MSIEVKIKHTSQDVIDSLSRQLSNAYILSIKYKKFHWYVSGAFFKQLHELFDMHYEQLSDIADDLAERSRMIGGYPAATAKEFIQHAQIHEAEATQYPPQEMVEILHHDTDKIIDALHHDIELATKGGDAGTADVYTRIVQTYQKQAWFLAETAARKGLM